VPGAQDATTLGQPELAAITLERLVAGPPGLPADIKAVLADAPRQSDERCGYRCLAQKSDMDLTSATSDQAAAIVRDQANFMAEVAESPESKLIFVARSVSGAGRNALSSRM